MSITLGPYTFEGPYSTTEGLKDRSGVYVIECALSNRADLDGESVILDIGESSRVKSWTDGHERSLCWGQNCSEAGRRLTVSVLYTPGMQKAGRMAVVQELKAHYHTECAGRHEGA